MPVRIVIAENQTSVEVALEDLPVNVPESGSVNITDTAPFWLIQESVSLQAAINNDEILINNGTSTLTKQGSLSYLWPS